MTMRRKFGP